MSNTSHDPILCPSATCETGNLLLGIVTQEGRVSILPEPVVINEAFVSIARQGRTPERRFRFSAPCVGRGCTQWRNGRCSVGDEVVTELGTSTEEGNLPACGIRHACRWFRQSGARACFVCPEVVTDTR
jgi:hypothetical protein